MRVLFLPSGSVVKPSPRMRVFQLLPELRRIGIDATAFDSTQLPPRFGARTQLYRPHVLKAARSADVVVIQKQLFDLPMLLALKAVNSRVVYDFDDAIYTRPDDPEGRPDPSASRRLRAVLRLARHVIAGNEELAEYARRFAKAVTVVPTVVDTDRYVPVSRDSSAERPLTIGWAGTAANLPCLRLLRSPLADLMRTAERPFCLRIVSSAAPIWPEVAMEHETWELERAVAAIQEFDIGVMPLPDTPWNRGKCGLKAIEYMALGVPTVASRVGALRSIILHGENGLLADTPADWITCLSRLITDAGLRLRLGASGRETVEARYSVKTAARTIASVFESISAHQGRRSHKAIRQKSDSQASAPRA